MKRLDDDTFPGAQPAHFLDGRQVEIASGTANEGHLISNGGDRDNPGEQPDEIVPTEPDTDRPNTAPDEIAPGKGDFDQPDRAPIESPPQPGVGPGETFPPD